MFHTGSNAMRKRCQYDQWDIWILDLDRTGNVECVTIIRTRHNNHQIKIRILQFHPSFLFCRNLSKTWRITKTEIHIFNEDFLINTSIIFQHKGIIWIGYQEDIEDSLGHQVHKRSILEV